MKETPVLFNDKKECCACGACLNVCPNNAITMGKDEFGFLYPKINETLCVSCGMCIKVCSFNKKNYGAGFKTPDAYAAASKDEEILKNSSSGGIFRELAGYVISLGGTIYGATWTDELKVRHIGITNKQELIKLQGSKYVQSDTANTFKAVKSELEGGKPVLFSGTPCQVSGLKSFLKKDYQNLYTIDIVCHGVPSIDFLQNDLALFQKDGKKVTSVTFRDKNHNWGHGSGTISAYTKQDAKSAPYTNINSPYYYYFLRGDIYRDSCYNCRYPSNGRVGDITLGDYWGIESAHPDIDKVLTVKNGVSCVLVNSDKGRELFEAVKDKLNIIPSNIEKVKSRNAQLVKCCKKTNKSTALFSEYEKSGYSGVFDFWKKNEAKAILKLKIKRLIPYKLKSLIERSFRRFI